MPISTNNFENKSCAVIVGDVNAAELSLHSDIPGEIMAVSENISSHGILLSSEAAIPEGTRHQTDG